MTRTLSLKDIRYPITFIIIKRSVIINYIFVINHYTFIVPKIYSDNELPEDSTIRKFRIVQKEGNREVARDVVHYNLQMIIALGFKVDNERAVQFRKWANE